MTGGIIQPVAGAGLDTAEGIIQPVAGAGLDTAEGIIQPVAGAGLDTTACIIKPVEIVSGLEITINCFILILFYHQFFKKYDYIFIKGWKKSNINYPENDKILIRSIRIISRIDLSASLTWKEPIAILLAIVEIRPNRN